MISLKNVSFAYQNYDESQSNEPVVKNINLDIKKGECVLLTGETGGGKTTILNIINGLIPEYYQGELKGEVAINDKDATKLFIAEKANKIGYLSQNTRLRFFNRNTSDEICFGAANKKMSSIDIKNRFEGVTKLFEIEHLIDRKIAKLSEGEKQLVALAAVVMTNPQIYLLDEPSANLDEDNVQLLRKVILHLKQQGATVIIAEQRLYYTLGLIDRVVFIKNSKIEFDLPRQSFLDSSNAKLLGMRNFKQKTIDELFINKYTTHNLSKSRGLFVDYMRFGYEKKVLGEYKYLNLPKNKVVAIVGKNGCGKTCFAKNLIGAEKSKPFIIKGVNVKAREQIKKCFMTMQDVNCQFYEESVIEEILTLTNQTEDDIIEAKEMLSIFGLEKYLQSSPATLSEGQKQCLAFVAALFIEKEIIIFDEPTTGLDHKNMLRFANMLKKLKNKAEVTLLITNDVELLEYCADIIVEIDKDGIYRCFKKRQI